MKKPVICFEDFSFKYRTQKEPTLKNINLTIYEGEKVLIAGPSGSGKSTLGHAINGLIPHSYQGEITGSLKIMDQETRDLDIFRIGQMTGTVLQDPDGQFIGLSVAEDIAFSLENNQVEQEEMKKQVWEAATLVEVSSHLNHSLHQLSGGQKQRVSLAGVLVGQTDILLFDEPLANLDPAAGKRAIELISQIQADTGKTVVIIEHRVEDVLHAGIDRVIVVDNGQIVSDSTPDELLATNVLETVHVRKPLYVSACEYAGCDITPDMRPSQLETFAVEGCGPQLVAWLKQQKPVSAEQQREPLLELKNLRFGYKPDKQTIKDLSFSIGKGEMVSIVGKNGAGKSTLTKLICGFEKPSAGSILYKGQDIAKDTIRQRAERIGMVMQNPNQMISKHMIYEEVALGLTLRGVPEDEVKRRVDHVLEICGLYRFRNWPISALSFGQKKRVTIASILVLEPEVLILDEPTAGQDFRHYTEMMEFIKELNERGVTILMVTHDMHLMLEYTPRAVAISDGRVIRDGSAIEVLADKGVIAEANLKETSLFELAEKAGLDDPYGFARHFIQQDREARMAWQ